MHLVGQLRRIIGDFGVPIAILIMVLVAYNLSNTFIQVRPKTPHSISRAHLTFIFRDVIVCVGILCAEIECSQRFLRDQSQQTRLAHQPPGLRRQIPHVDDVRLLLTSPAGLYPDLYGDSDHHVSSSQMNISFSNLLH